MIRSRVVRWVIEAHPYHPAIVAVGAAALVVLASCGARAEFKKPRPVPDRVCVQVRVGVAAVGLDSALRWARDQGYTSVQIMQAKRQCLTKEVTQ